MPSEPSSRVNGVRPGVERADERVEELVGDARAARADLVGAGRHRRAHDRHGEDQAGAAGVAAQQVEPVALAVALGNAVGRAARRRRS